MRHINAEALKALIQLRKPTTCTTPTWKRGVDLNGTQVLARNFYQEP